MHLKCLYTWKYTAYIWWFVLQPKETIFVVFVDFFHFPLKWQEIALRVATLISGKNVFMVSLFCVNFCMTFYVDISFYLTYPWLRMGIYLSSPKTEKFSEDGGNPRLRFGLSSMQGWRASMEDAVSNTIKIFLKVNF